MADKRNDPRKIKAAIAKKEEALGAIYTAAYKEILDVIERDAGTLWRKERSKRMLANLNGILKGLDQETRAFIEREIPNFYREIAKNAQYDLAVEGVVIEDAFSKIHKEAVSSIADAAKTRFAESLQAVKRDALSKIKLAEKAKIRETIGVGATLGKAQEVVAREVTERLAASGISALKDKAGKTWQLDRYARMLTGEVLANAARSSVENIGLENGFDVYQISRHGAKDACRFHEGRIFSLTGKTPGLPTLEQLKASGEIFHVGCRHSYFVLTDYSKKQAETVGKTAERLAAGKKISNYDANKNPGASEAATLKRQEKRRAALGD